LGRRLLQKRFTSDERKVKVGVEKRTQKKPLMRGKGRGKKRFVQAKKERPGEKSRNSSIRKPTEEGRKKRAADEIEDIFRRLGSCRRGDKVI